MAGLLDFLDSDEGRLGLGLLMAGGQRSDGAGFGQRISEGMQYAKTQKDNDIKRQNAQNQMAQEKAARDDVQYKRDMAARFSGGPGGYDYRGFADAISARDPAAGLAMQQSLGKESMFNKVDPKDFTRESVAQARSTGNVADLVPVRKMEVSSSGEVFDPYGIKPGQFMSDPNKPFAAGPQGPVANAAYQRYEFGKARSGAANVSNTVSVAGPENKYNMDIGAGLAKDGLALVDAAKGAPDAVRNARAITNALDAGAITGSGADTRLLVQKAMETAGMVGPGKAASTQELMSGLSKLTLGGIKTSGLGGGQGFTDKDREFLNAAMSGTITDTPDNLRRVANLAERQAIATHGKGQAVIKRWQADPALRAVAQDTTLDPIAPNAASAPRQQSPGQAFDSKPPAQQFKGKFATFPDGKRYRSDGMIWKEVQ